MKKVLLITNIISPYRIPLFNYINSAIDYEFKVIALSENENNRHWEINKENIGFDYKILPGFHSFIQSKDWGLHINLGLSKELLSYDPDIIITSGYDNLAYWHSLLYAKMFSKKYILWNGSTLLSSSQNSILINKLKKLIISASDKYITYGTKAKEYLESYGAQSQDIYVGCNTVDIEYYYNKTNQYRKTEEFQQRRGKYPEILLLFVGQLIERKGIIELLKAFEKIDAKEIGLMVLGTGPLEKKLKKDFGDLDNLFFKGFVQKENIYKYYALSDCLFVPSYEEVWGLVVNEGIASGNFVLASNQVGAAYDIINDDTGLIFETDNMVKQLKEKIKFCLTNKKEIINNRDKRREYAVNNLSIKNHAGAYIEAIYSFEK